jgi:hypothetical protein
MSTDGRAPVCCELDRIMASFVEAFPGECPRTRIPKDREFVGGGQSVGEVVTGWVG